MRVKIVVDGEEKFNHGCFDNLADVNDCTVQKYDLEEYTVPAVIRKILKTTKLREIVEVRCKQTDKLLDNFDDHIFNKEFFKNIQSEAVITFALMEHDQKDYLFKLLINEKIERFTFLKNMANKFFKGGNYHKAEKLYMRINSYFRTKDAKNNFSKEDEQTTMYRDGTEELDNVIYLHLIPIVAE